jgi:hypothetical protein
MITTTRRTVRAAVALCAVATLSALLSPAAATPAGPNRAAGQTITLPIRDALTQLPVAAEDRTGYVRTAFKHWVDADGDGCNTRQEVLKDEAVITPVQGARCALTGGEWYSPYDDTNVQGASGLDIDHLVPLAEAWDSGASTWTPVEREAYAYDPGDPRDLIAVTSRSNRSKADQDPTTWLPPATGYCTYITDWITDRLRWSLAIDPTEQTALQQDLEACPITTAR